MRSTRVAVVLLLLGSATAVGAQAPARPSPIAGYVTEAATRSGIPEAWIWSVMRVESAGELHAVSRAGAMGLMQLMPPTWTDMRARLALGDDPFDPHDNLLAGAAYLRAMHDRYGAPGFLAAYNAGPARYDDYLRLHRPLPLETLAYVGRLSPLMGGGTLVDPLAWTKATLFVGTGQAGLAAPGGTAGRQSATVPAAITPSADGLFIRTSNVVAR